MIRAMTSAEKTKVRSDAQFCVYDLIIPTPTVIATGQLSAAPSSNDSVVELSWTKSSGDVNDIVSGLTCWIGSTAGGFDKGVVRIRKLATATILYIGETSEIQWVGNEYITVVQEFAVWRRDNRTVSETLFYMDWSEAYSNQHAVPKPLVNMGIDAVVDIKDGEVITQWNASGSQVIVGSVASFLWTAPTASSTSGLTTSTPSIGFNVVGTHLVTCTATTDLGATRTSYRFVHAINSDQENVLPEFELGPISSTFEDGGWRCEVTIHAAVDIPDRARVVISARDWYQGTESNVGYMTDRKNIVFIGWVIERTVVKDPITHYTTFRVSTPQHWLRMIKAFPEGVEDTDFADNGGGVPNRWIEMQNNTPTKGLWAFLEWRTTVPNCCDCFIVVDAKEVARTASPTGTLWDQMIAMCNQVNLFFPVFNKFSQLYVGPNLSYVPLDERSNYPIVMDITTEDYAEITIQRRVYPGLYYAEVTGVKYADGTGVPIGARAPGSTWRYMGESELVYAELAMGTQDEAIELAGLVLGSKADDPAFVDVTLVEINRMFDIAPPCYVTITVDTNEGVQYAQKRMIVRGVTFEYNPELHFQTTRLELESEGIQLPAVAMTFPSEGAPPVIPPPNYPPYTPPPPTVPPPNPPPPAGSGEALVVVIEDIRTTDDLSAGSPDWETEL